MKYFIVILFTICMLLGGCKVPAEQTIPQDTFTEQQTPPETDDIVPPETDYPVPPDLPPAGTDSDAPPPEEGPEGLPTPAL